VINAFMLLEQKSNEGLNLKLVIEARMKEFEASKKNV
jgi:hypothetical protein